MAGNFSVHANSFAPNNGQSVIAPSGANDSGGDPKAALKTSVNPTSNATKSKSKGNRNGNGNDGKKINRNNRNGNVNSNSNANNNSHGNTNGNSNRHPKPGGGGSRKESRKGTDFSLSDILQSETKNKRGEISISHLLDLGPDHRHQHQNQSGRRRNVAGGNFTYGNTTTSSNSYLDKISYINMTCRFVLDPRIDYKFLLNDPDSHVPMENVLRVICPPATCPICLEGIPEAPRMLECGHLICYPCLFRYLAAERIGKSGEAMHKQKNKDCPLCLERIRLEKVKPVTLAQVGDERFDIPKVDGEAILQLMFRPNDSLLSVPRDTVGVKKRDFYDLPLVNNFDINQCSRLIRGSLEYAIFEFEREISELKKTREQNRLLYQDDGYWHTEAIKMIQEIIDIYGEEGNVSPSKSGSESKATTSPAPIYSGQSTPQIHKIGDLQIEGNVPLGSFENHQPNEPLSDEFNKLKIEGDELKNDRLLDNSQAFYTRFQDDNAFFFYQTGSLQALTKFFLAPLDIRILKKAYGSYSNFPSIIVAKVDNVLYGTIVNDELRKRMKYLGHLPTQTPIGFLECDWKDVVPSDILKSFNKELQLRRKRKLDKEKREERDQKRVQREEEEQFRRDLLQESSYPYSFGSSQISGSFDNSEDPLLAPVPAVTVDDGSSSINNESKTTTSSPWGNKTSFAQAAAISKAEQDGRVINEILSEAEHTRKGRKKLILMSNRH